jgi:hypothetical protein
MGLEHANATSAIATMRLAFIRVPRWLEAERLFVKLDPPPEDDELEAS